MTLGELAYWWGNREHSQISMTDGRVSLHHAEAQEGAKELELEFVTAYGSEGFKVERLADSNVIELSRGSEK
jgi:hypothetical protein